MTKYLPNNNARGSVKARRGASRAVLLAALRPDTQDLEELAFEHAAHLDWEWILERSQVHKVEALLAHRLCDLKVSPFPDEVRRRLKSGQEASFLRGYWSRETLRRVAGALDEAGVPFVLLKGAFLSEHVYRNPAVRTPCDVDVLVSAHRTIDADKALGSIGYRLTGAFPKVVRLAAEPDQQLHQAYNGVIRGREVLYAPGEKKHLPVDLHWNLWDPISLKAKPVDIHAHTVYVTVAGIRLRVLDREAMLVHLASHAMIGHPAHLRLIHFADLLWYLSRFGVECNAERVRAIAHTWRVEVYLDRALQIIQEILGTIIPEHLQPFPEPDFLRRACFERVTSRMVEGALPRRGKNVDGRWASCSMLLWYRALRVPTGYATTQLVWPYLKPMLPDFILAKIQRSSLLRRLAQQPPLQGTNWCRESTVV